MIYRTDCDCVSSYPEPSPAEFVEFADFRSAWSAWREEWDSVAADHTLRCPSSASCSDSLLTYDRVREQHQHLLDQLARDREATR